MWIAGDALAVSLVPVAVTAAMLDPGDWEAADLHKCQGRRDLALAFRSKILALCRGSMGPRAARPWHAQASPAYTPRFVFAPAECQSLQRPITRVEYPRQNQRGIC